MIETKNLHLASLSPLVVQVKELTTGDMRALLRAREHIGEGDIDPLEMLTIGDGLLLSDLSVLTNLTPAQIDKLTEANLDAIVAAAKEINPRFFAQILGTLSRFAALNLNASAPSSSATSSLSSRQATRTPGTTP